MNRLLFPLALVALFFACKKPSALLNENEGWQDYRVAVIINVSVYDTLPKKMLDQLEIKSIAGMRATYQSGKFTTYLSYETPDHNKLLTAMQAIPFRISDVADTLCRDMDRLFSLNGKTVLSSDEIEAADFFWDIDPTQFAYYECTKGNQRHTLLISRNSNRVLHRIEA
jgi:hypothetical protein